MRRGAGKIGVAEDIAGAVDAGSFAIPEAKYPMELALAAQLGLLRAPERGGGEVLVQAGLELDVVFVEIFARADKLLVKRAERRAPIAGDEAGRIEPRAPVA